MENKLNLHRSLLKIPKEKIKQANIDPEKNIKLNCESGKIIIESEVN